MTRLAIALGIGLRVGLRVGLLVGLLCGLLPVRSALADPAKVLVLPLDGDADPSVRAKYSAAVQRMARSLGGKVTPGDVTFTDTATAIGCDPKAPRCAEDVRATLGVDELIYGDGVPAERQARPERAPRRQGQAAARRGGDARESRIRRSAPSRRSRRCSGPRPPRAGRRGLAEPRRSLGASHQPDAGRGDAPRPRAPARPRARRRQPERPAGPSVSRNKVLGYTAIGGGATLLLISFALWSSASGLEDDISSHPVTSHADFHRAARDLEDTARTRAWTGNVLFLLGLRGRRARRLDPVPRARRSRWSSPRPRRRAAAPHSCWEVSFIIARWLRPSRARSASRSWRPRSRAAFRAASRATTSARTTPTATPIGRATAASAWCAVPDRRPPVPGRLHNGCDPNGKTCKILRNQSNKCNSATCPSGYACTFDCTGPNARMACCARRAPSRASSTAPRRTRAAISDAAPASRAPSTAPRRARARPSPARRGRAPRTVPPSGACQEISCSSSCACNVTCPTGACDTMLCPSPGATERTKTGAVGAECSSTVAAECSTCQ